MAARRRAQQRERVVRWVAIAGIFVFAIWFLFFRGRAPDSIAGHPVQHFDLAGGGEHTETPVNYESVPPVSGPHSQNPYDCGTYGSLLSDEKLVHNLEHGAVGIFFDPQTDPEVIETIETLAKSYDSHLISAPYPGMEQPFALTAWGHMMRLEEFDEAAVKAFIEEFRQGGDAPESFQDCPMVSRDSAVPQPTPIPTTSPSPTDAQGDDGKKDGGKSGGAGGGKGKN